MLWYCIICRIITATNQNLTNVNTKQGNYFSEMVTKKQECSGELYSDKPMVSSVPMSLKMDYSRVLQKPFLIGNIPWTSSNTIYSELNRFSFPSSISTNYLASIPFNSTARYRMKTNLILQVSGTPMHQGTLIAACLPHNTPKIEHPNQILSAPHCFLYANESTAICVELPFYSNTTLLATPEDRPLTLKSNGEDFGDLVIFVLNPLIPATSASSSLTLSVHADIRDSEFYVPKTETDWAGEALRDDRRKLFKNILNMTSVGVRMALLLLLFGDADFDISDFVSCFDNDDEFEGEGFQEQLKTIPTYIFDGLAKGARKVTGDLIDAGRGALKYYTGFHNPNEAAICSRMIRTDRNFHNNVDQPNLFEKLDQHAQFDRITQDYIFESKVDEMDINHLLSKPMFVARSRISTAQNAGEVIFAQPISPFIETGANSNVFYSPMRVLYETSRYWRGSLKLHIQANMTNFQYCKLLVVRNYQVNQRVLSQFPTYNDVHNLMTDTLEFSAGGQIHCVDLPFCSITDQLPCTKSLELNAIQHGMIYCYLLQPLTTNGTVATNIDFNFYISAGPDFQYYGYAYDAMNQVPGSLPLAASALDPEEEILDMPPDQNVRRRMTTAHDAMNQVPGSLPLAASALDPEEEILDMPPDQNVRRRMSLPRNTPKIEYPTTADYAGEASVNPETDYIPSRPIVQLDEHTERHDGDSAKVTVESSDQQPLLIHEERYRESDLRAIDFKPMVNIRDYLRRVYPITTVSNLGSELANNFLVLDIALLLRGNSNSTSYLGRKSPFIILKKMFYGFNGGLKFKLRVFGNSNAGVAFLPPGYVYSGTTGYVESATMDVPATTTSNFLRLDNTLFKTNSNCRLAAPFIHLPTIQTRVNDIATPYTELEFVIPNYNLARFVGSELNYVDSTVVTAADNLGQILVMYDEKSTTTSKYVEVSMGLTDESRVGFQVYNPPNVVPTIGVAPTGRRITAEMDFNGVGPPTYSNDQAGNAYYALT